jgi:Spy/CpxP family protein refolding chaperone
MNLKSVRKSIAVTAVLCLFLVTSAFSGGMNCGPQCLTPGVALTPDQETKVKAIYDRFQENTKAAREQLALAESAPSDQSGSFDESAVRSAAEARARAHVEVEVAFAKARAEAANLLTAEQKAQLAEHQKMMAEEMGKCHRNHGEGGH